MVIVEMAPECAHDVPRPRNARLAAPRQLVIDGTTADKFGLAVTPCPFAKADHGLPLGASPWTDCSAAFMPDEPFIVY